MNNGSSRQVRRAEKRSAWRKLISKNDRRVLFRIKDRQLQKDIINEVLRKNGIIV